MASVQATYAAPLHFLSSDHWIQIRAGLSAQLPLRDIQWKPPSRTSVRTIQKLDINLVALDALRDEATSQIPTTLLERPLLNIYVVACDDNEAYKNTVKKQIKDWHITSSQRKSQEWLIVLVARPDGRASTGGFSKLRGTVLDRIKADFNTDKKDRCAQLTWSNAVDSPSAWSDVILKIKEGISSAFVTAVAQREEEVKRSESQRQMPGWNFCTFFILKETLASSFEGMNLHEDAKIQYDELEASFFQVLKEKNLSFFGKIIEPNPKDDSSPLLSVTKKPYRDLILANAISVFDFRVYLIAQQCSLLGKLGDFSEICIKVGIFLGSFAERLREVKDALPEHFVESWVYSSAVNTVDKCDEWAQKVQTGPPATTSFNAAKGQLLELARNQLDRLGVYVDYLPREQPFWCPEDNTEHDPALGASSSDKNKSLRQITNAELATALAEKSAFYDLYIRLTNRAIDLYAKGGRRKFALKLHGSLAALDLYRGRYATAIQTYTSLPAHYSPHRWSSLESLMLFRGMETYARMGNDKHREWLHIAFSFLKSFIGDSRSDLLTDIPDKCAYVTDLMKEVYEAASRLDETLLIEDHPAISIRVEHMCKGRCAETQDGCFLDVAITNHLPCNFAVDEITMNIAGRESEEGQFSTDITELNPGRNVIRLFCPLPLHGTFSVETRTVRFAKVVLQWGLSQTSRKHRSILKRTKSPQLVILPKDALALDVTVQQPLCVQVGSPTQLSMKIKTGRNMIDMCLLKLSSPHAQFSHVTAKEEDTIAAKNPSLVQFFENNISVSALEKDQTISFLVPYTAVTGIDLLKVKIEIEYVTTEDPTVRRKMILTRVVSTSLAIVINVQDFFRGHSLFSKFAISTTSHQHVRILSADLIPSDEDRRHVKIKGSAIKETRITTVTPAQPANFTFLLKRETHQVKDFLRLHVTYRLLREEVENLLCRHIESLSSDPSFASYADEVHTSIVRALERDSSWVQPYEVTGELIVPEICDPNDPLSKEIGKLREALRRNVGFDDGEWREAIIPVDMPTKQILTAVRMSLSTSPYTQDVSEQCKRTSIFAGQPVTVTISFQTTFHWSAGDVSASEQYSMRYEIEEMVKDWLIGGQKRGDFTATDNAKWTVPVTLVALHHGELRLPRVSVHALPVGQMQNPRSIPSYETYQVHGAERVLVLPRAGRTTFVVNVDDDG